MFTSADLVSPMSKGALSGTTVELLANQGKQLANDIEQQSVMAEAEAKAPAISTLYGGAYQKIAAGDFSGFADLSKARSLATGNPILMKTLDNADNLAGTLANEFTRNKIAQINLQKSEDATTARANIAELGANTRLRVAGQQDDAKWQREQSALADHDYRQAHFEWDKQNDIGDKQTKAQQAQWDRSMATRAQAKAQGIDTSNLPDLGPRPPDYKPTKEPQSKDFERSGGTPLPSSGLPQSPGPASLDLTDVPPPFQSSGPTPIPAPSLMQTPAATQLPDAGLTPEQIQDIQNYHPLSSTEEPGLQTNNPDVLPSQSSSQLENEEPGTQQPATVGTPIAAQAKSKTDAGQPANDLTFGYDPQAGTYLTVNLHPQAVKITGVNLKTGGEGGDSLSLAGKPDPRSDRALEIMHGMREDMSTFAARSMSFGFPVDVVAVDANKENGAYVMKSRMGVMSEPVKQPDGSTKQVPVQISKSEADEWHELKKMIPSVVTVAPGELHDVHKEQWRQKALADFATGSHDSNDLAQANQQLAQLKAQPITQDDIQAYKDNLQAPIRQRATDKWNKRVDSELDSAGLLPEKEKPQSATIGSEQIHAMGRSLNDLIQQRNAIGKGDTPEKLKQLRDLQQQIIVLRDNMVKAQNSAWTFGLVH